MRNERGEERVRGEGWRYEERRAREEKGGSRCNRRGRRGKKEIREKISKGRR